jgi:hypothetical protein
MGQVRAAGARKATRTPPALVGLCFPSSRRSVAGRRGVVVRRVGEGVLGVAPNRSQYEAAYVSSGTSPSPSDVASRDDELRELCVAGAAAR